jgi:ATPase subunit of ABC transporter with duplicated ATPase domains
MVFLNVSPFNENLSVLKIQTLMLNLYLKSVILLISVISLFNLGRESLPIFSNLLRIGHLIDECEKNYEKIEKKKKFNLKKKIENLKLNFLKKKKYKNFNKLIDEDENNQKINLDDLNSNYKNRNNLNENSLNTLNEDNIENIENIEENFKKKKFDSKIFIRSDNFIKFYKVDCITPTGRLLSDNINFTVTKNKNLLIVGPSGNKKNKK